MQEAMIDEVRRFNRTVTAHIGALNDRFLGRSRPLGEARLLWEIGPEGCELRSLRSRLELDSGYVSRLMRSLEAASLVTVVPSEADGRTRVARLTSAGLAERKILDERSDDLARSLLEPLTGAQQDHLVSAMRDVERLLTAAIVEIKPVDRPTPTPGGASTPTSPSLTGDRNRDSIPRPASARSHANCDRRPGCCCWPTSAQSRSAVAR